MILSIATGQVPAGHVDANTPTPIPVVFAILSALLWFVGSLVFALGLLRAKAVSAVAGWLIVLGAVVTPMLVIAVPQDTSPIAYLPWMMYGVGWVLVGYAARTPAPDIGIAGQAS